MRLDSDCSPENASRPGLQCDDATGRHEWIAGVAGRLASEARADKRCDRTILEARHCQRSECGSRRDRLAVCGEGDRELFMNSAEAGSMGMSTVPRASCMGAAKYLETRGSTLHLNTNVESAAWDEAGSQWSIVTRSGTLRSEFLVTALPFEAMQKLLPHPPPADEVNTLAQQVEGLEHWPICSVHLGSIARLRNWIMPRCSIARFTGCTTRASCSHGASSRAVTWNWWSAHRAASRPRPAKKRLSSR